MLDNNLRRDAWDIDISGDAVVFRRWSPDRDHVEETYAPVSIAKAAIFAVAIIHGFQPPRSLVCLDTPSERIPPE